LADSGSEQSEKSVMAKDGFVESMLSLTVAKLPEGAGVAHTIRVG
jgi:hypothetical protein